MNKILYLPHWVTLSVLLILSACVSNPERSEAIHYACDQGTNLSVVFSERTYYNHRRGRNHEPPRIRKVSSMGIITLGNGEILTLPKEKVTTGFMLTNGRYTLRGDSKNATWAVGKMAEEQCIAK